MIDLTSTSTSRPFRGLLPLLLAVAAALLGLSLIVALAPAASAAPPLFWETQVGQKTPGARGIAANPNNGHLFVSDQSGSRIVELTAWGTFVKTWGWDVVETGPGDDTVAPEDQFEICVPADGDVCKAGISGIAGTGQFFFPYGVAVDSSGNVYVAETASGSRWVQKFSPEGEFLLSFGGGVNQGGGTPENPGNVCTAQHIANGDVCGAGTAGSGPGEFADAPPISTRIAITPDDKVYVGDVERIQRFDTGGVYQGEIAVPGETINSLAVDAAGYLYAAYQAGVFDNEPNVHKLDPTTGAELLTFSATKPSSIAVAPNGEVYAFDEGSFAAYVDQIRRFAPDGAEIELFGEGFKNAQNDSGSTGIAVNDVTCAGGIAIYPTKATSPSFVRAYSPVPDPDCVGPPPSVPPTIADQAASSVSFTAATLTVQLNPHFWEDTTYYAQYATGACIEGGGWEAPCVAERPEAPGATLNTGVTSTAVTRSLDIEGLTPDTAYRFRFVAESSGGGPVIGPEQSFTTYRTPEPNTACPNQALRSGAAAKLPDCRAYEMVSPIDKNGGDIVAYYMEGFETPLDFNALDRSAPGGDKITYTSAATFADAIGSPAYSQYIATRTASGWETEAINAPQRGGNTNGVLNLSPEYKAFSEDLSTGWVMPESGLPLTDPGPTEGYRNLYRRDLTSGAFTWLESSGPDPEPCVVPDCGGGEALLYPDLQGVAEDGSCAAFRVNDALADAPKGVARNEGMHTVAQLYLWCEGNGVRLVSVLPNGTPFEGVSSAGTENGAFGIESPGLGHVDTVENALSGDGHRLYWTASEGGLQEGTLYLRINADKPQSLFSEGKCSQPTRACTLQISPAGNKAQFWNANQDASRAIFSIKSGPLAGDLYEYELASKEATLIAGETRGVAGASEDLSRFYFASEEVLSGSEENSEGDVAEAGEPNLYLREGGAFTFIGTLLGEDVSNAQPSPLATVPRAHVARASAEADHLAFVSAAQLTGYDNDDAASGKPDRQVYLYGAEDGELICASCNPSGARPQGADLGLFDSTPVWTAAWIPGYQHKLYPRRPLSEDGNRLFFNAVDALVPQDVNDALDVYQWEAPESGDCTEASPSFSSQNEGCVALISSGESSRDSEFVDASASGDDVFIRTSSPLDPRDPGLVDIYDARVGGGIPIPADPVPCEGDACQAAPGAPEDPTPASQVFEGAGNLPPEPPSCGAEARRAKRLAKRSKRLLSAAKRSSTLGRSRQLRARAKRDAAKAKRLRASAKRCRAQRANPDRRTAR